MDSPDISQNPASAIGTAFLANGGAPQADGDASAQPTPAPAPAAPAPSPEQQQAAAQTAKHTAVGRFFSNLTGSGSGSSASKLWRAVIGGALAGLAGAGAAEDGPVIHGPYGDVRSNSMVGAASRGAQAGINMAQQQQDRQRKQAQQDAEEKRKNQESQNEMDRVTLAKAADARAQQDSIQRSVEHEKIMQLHDIAINNGNLDLAARAAKAAQDQVNSFNTLQEANAEPLTDPDGKSLQFSTHEEAEQAAHDNPKFFIGDFKTRTNYDPSTGKYGVYRIPDTDLKNVQLKDPVTGTTHTYQRMPASQYYDYQTRAQNLTKAALGIEEAKVRLQQLREDRKSGSAYSKALAELDKVGGDADKLSPSSRTLLYTTASKNLGDAIRAKTSADKAEDAEAGAAASQAIQHYSGVLSQLHGNKPAPQGDVPSSTIQVQIPGQPVGNIPADKLDDFMRKHPDAKRLGAGAASPTASNAPINVQLPDGSMIPSSPENVGKYLNSNKGAKIADADAKRFQQWSADKKKQDQEDLENSNANLQD